MFNESSLELDLTPIFEEEIPSLEAFKGKPLLVLFFYLGCPGCKGRAIPVANKLVYEEVPIHVIGVHTRFEGKEYSKIEYLIKYYYNSLPKTSYFASYLRIFDKKYNKNKLTQNKYI